MASSEIYEPKPVFVLHGNDEYLKAGYRRKIIDSLLGANDRETSLVEYDEGVPEFSAVLDNLRTLPFLASRRVVVIRGADPFVTANRDKLESYFDNPSEHGSLVLSVKSWNKNTKLAKSVAEIGEVIDCKCPEEGRIVEWIKKKVRESGKKIQPHVASALLADTGHDLWMLDAEIGKLVSYAWKRDEITSEDVAAVSISSSSPEAFAVVDSIVHRDCRGALGHLGEALNIRGAEMMLLGQLAWHTRRTLLARRIIDSGVSVSEAMKAAKVWGSGRAVFEKYISRSSTRKIESDMRRVLNADLGVKAGADPVVTLQKLVVELCG